MNDWDMTLPPELESALTDFYTAPQPDPAYALRLEFDLRRRFDGSPRALKKNKFQLEGFMQAFRTRPLFAILVVVLSLLALTGVAYAIGRLAGFIPGYGFTSDAEGVYVLSEPVKVKSNGFVIKLEKAIQDKDSLAVELNAKNDTPYDMPYIQSVSIILLDGNRIDPTSRFESGGNVRFIFPPLAEPLQPVTLSVFVDKHTEFGNYISLPFQLRPAQPDDMVAQSTQTAPVVDHHDGLALSLDSIVYASDKTILQVSLKFDQPGNIGGPWGVILADENGIPYPLQDITPPSESYHTETSADGRTSTTSMGPGDAVRIYETVPLAGKGPMKLSLSAVPVANVPFSIYVYGSSEAFIFDPGFNPQIGQTWQRDDDISMGNIHFRVTSAELVEDNGPKLVFHAKSTDPTLSVDLSPDDRSITHSVFSVPDQDGMTISFPLSRLPDKPIRFLLTMAAYKPSTPWQVSWQPPAQAAQASGLPTSTPIPTAVRAEYPTVSSSDPLVLEVQALTQKYDLTLQKGPGWVHLINEYSKDPEPGTIPYVKEEEWYEVDENGWVLRSVLVDRIENETIIGQSASVGGYSVNFTMGTTFYNPNAYRVSIDNVSRPIAGAMAYGVPYSREVTTCDEGSPCLLITSLRSVHSPKEMPLAPRSGWRVWINLETGQQMKQEEFHLLEDGSVKVDYTFRYLLIEKVAVAPQEILDILKNVVAP